MNRPGESGATAGPDGGASRGPAPVPGAAAAPDAAAASRRRHGGRGKLLLLIAVCIAPVIASYLAYYVFPPSGRTNYGDLIEPQQPVPAFGVAVIQRGDAPAALDAAGLAALRGRWILLAVDAGGCDRHCAEKLFFVRQTQVSLGRERERLAQVLLLTDAMAPSPELQAAHPDMVMLRTTASELAPLLPLPPGGRLTEHLFLIDPLQNLMMRFPRDPDPAKVRKDLQRLLKASRIG
ncbi:MAG: cytochrome C oxidase subunit I [Lautropia sp.]